MAAGSGTASYNPPSPLPPPPLLGVVLSVSTQAKDPREFWTQLYEAGVIDRSQLLPLVETYFINNPTPPMFQVT